MTFVLYTNSVSAHQLPLAREIVKRIGTENFRYIYTGDHLQGGNQEVKADEPWIAHIRPDSDTETEKWLTDCDCLLSGIRDIELFKKRAEKGLRTFYQSERWFKPIPIKLSFARFNKFHNSFLLPGILRMLVPSYRQMVRRLVVLLKRDENFFYYAIGPWAKKDMLRIGCPKEKIVDWGYFVEPSIAQHSTFNLQPEPHVVRVLWVGRMLDWKRVDTIIRAFALTNKRMSNSTVDLDLLSRPRLTLTLVGDGPEKCYLQKLSNSAVNNNLQPKPITFLHSVSITEVRSLMRQHDIYILSSNAQEGWGAALNEAMEEGMICIGTHEAGASAALLPENRLFHSGNYRVLARILSDCSKSNTVVPMPIEFTPYGAAGKLLGKSF